MSTGVKILTLAFHPSTPENEAVAAFLKARRAIPDNPDFSVLFSPSKQTKSNYDNSPKKDESKYTISYRVKVSLLNLPLLLEGLKNYKSTPYYIIKIISQQWRLTDRIEMDLDISLDSFYEKETFKIYLNKLIDTINK